VNQALWGIILVFQCLKQLEGGIGVVRTEKEDIFVREVGGVVIIILKNKSLRVCERWEGR
jgi:hypothetical protein